MGRRASTRTSSRPRSRRSSAPSTARCADLSGRPVWLERRARASLSQTGRVPAGSPPCVLRSGRSAAGENGSVPLYRDEAIVLRTQKLGEADRIVTLLTREHGRVRAVAKGVRKTTSRARGAGWSRSATSTCSCTRAAASTSSPRPSRCGRTARRSSATTRATPRDSVMLETAERLTDVEREPAVQQYLLLVGGLRALADGEHAPGLVLDAYLLRSLAVAGYAPSFDDCARCGAEGPHRVVLDPVRRRGVRRVPGARLGEPGRGDARPAGRPAHRRLGDRRRRGRSGTAARAAASSPPTCSGTSSAACARSSTWSGREARAAASRRRRAARSGRRRRTPAEPGRRRSRPTWCRATWPS